MSEPNTLDQPIKTPKWGSQSRLYGLTKRVIDLAFSFLFLLLLSPLLASIAIAIKLDSPGPVLSRRRVLGRWGRPFDMYKFRTMHITNTGGFTNQTTDGIYKVKYDPRVTRIGRFLRRSSIDEIPQLFNVLRGEMSLVGPTAAFPFELALRDELTRSRLEVQPGLTGLWQISGRSSFSSEDVMKIDLYYVSHASLFLDLRILIQTIPEALKGRRAY